MKEIDTIFQLVDEVEKIASYRNNLILKTQELDREYQHGKHEYFQYKKKLESLLKGKTLNDWIDYYDSQIIDLLEKARLLNSGIFRRVYVERKGKPLAEAHEETEELVQETVHLVKPVPPKPVPIPVSARKIVQPKISPFAKREEKPKVVELIEKAQVVSGKPYLRKEAKPETAEIIELKAKIQSGAKPEFTAEELEERARSMEKIETAETGLKMYKPSVLGMVANRYFRKLGDYVTSKYPESFGRLFKALRLANMKILSNTYVDIILLITTLVFLFSFLVLFFAGLLNPDFFTLFFRPFFLSLLISIIAFIGVYAYPYIKADQRRKLIEANLPFAINHMAAVATSGLPPYMMFKIVSQSKEYSEVGVELRRLVEYVEVFGYDLTTALQVVSNSTPSRDFKEFLDGGIATLTSGGDFDYFLKEKSDQAMFAYKLRKEKYTEIIATYSDVYMGIMVVAPVFFIALLSLVSILGGTILGMDIQTIIVLGTYALIPMLNVLFLLFLEVSQPVD